LTRTCLMRPVGCGDQAIPGVRVETVDGMVAVWMRPEAGHPGREAWKAFIEQAAEGRTGVFSDICFLDIDLARRGLFEPFVKLLGVSIILAEQNPRAALSVASYGYILDQGKVVLEPPRCCAITRMSRNSILTASIATARISRPSRATRGGSGGCED